jgi:signal peptidase I
MNLRWFYSATFRHAGHMLSHVHKLVSAQRDILSPSAILNVEKARGDLRAALALNGEKSLLLAKMKGLEDAANEWLKPYPTAGMRENVEVLLVAIAVAMAIRTFFLQPFKIPTGSMQPTLWGITPENLIDRPDVKLPNFFAQLFSFWFNGVQYKHVVAKCDGALIPVDETPQRFLLFNLRQRFTIGGKPDAVWFPPDKLWDAVSPGRIFKKGEDVIRLKTYSGDHLFVDRLTYNFRRPKRGEIIVFETSGIERMQRGNWGQFYIKRLVALSGERVRIGDDRRLIIDGHRLDASTPHFEHVYSFDGPPRESQYSGHLNERIAEANGRPTLAPLFGDENQEFIVGPHHYMVMGDNTMNSSDSRTWGDFPRENVIGKSFCVYWPIGSQDGRSSRFGLGSR